MNIHYALPIAATFFLLSYDNSNNSASDQEQLINVEYTCANGNPLTPLMHYSLYKAASKQER